MHALAIPLKSRFLSGAFGCPLFYLALQLPTSQPGLVALQLPTSQPGRHPARLSLRLRMPTSHPARCTQVRSRASRSSLDLEVEAGTRTGTACRSAAQDRIGSLQQERSRCSKAPDSSPKSGDGTFRRRSRAHPRRQRFTGHVVAGRPCRMFVQEVLSGYAALRLDLRS